jgi:uncharacterized protein YjbI with pentapeptide repeats
MGRSGTAVDEPHRGTVDSVAARVSLIPRLLLELVTHPFRDSTLVKRNGQVLVVRRGADLSGADLSDVDLSRADLRGANFQGAYLARANLQGADLGEANLSGAMLSQANLRRANLEGASLFDCDLSYADLWGARVNPKLLVEAEANLEGTLLSNDSPF